MDKIALGIANFRGLFFVELSCFLLTFALAVLKNAYIK